jgi:hypothetical protein
VSIRDCLNTLRQAGEIDAEEAESLAAIYESLVRHFGGDVNRAKAELVDRLLRQAQNQKRQKGLYDEAIERAQQYILNYRNARGEPDPARALVYLIEHNGQVPMPDNMSSVTGRACSTRCSARSIARRRGVPPGTPAAAARQGKRLLVGAWGGRTATRAAAHAAIAPR